MDILMRYGFSIEEIKNMMVANDDLENVLDQDILDLINILIDVGCHEEHIMNIFICNPFVLSRNISDIKSLIKKLESLKIKNLYMVFDSNPYLLNLTINEIDNIYKNKKKEGLDDDEIADYFYHNIVI